MTLPPLLLLHCTEAAGNQIPPALGWEAAGGAWPGPSGGRPVLQAPARHGSSRGVPSQPERGAGCVSAPVRIWANGPNLGKPESTIFY